MTVGLSTTAIFGHLGKFRDQLASLDRHAQLKRCFSAVAGLLVYECYKYHTSVCMLG